MTINEAIEMAEEFLKIDVPRLQETGGTAMKFIVVAEDGWRFLYVPQPEAINSESIKSQLAAKVKEMVHENNADAVMVISDAWVGTASSKDKKTLERIEKLGLPRAHALGLIKKTEALICKIQVRGSIEQAMLTWHYDRDINDKITMGEREIKRGHFEGRLSSFFEDAPAGHA